MKVDFVKVETILSETLRKIFIERLSELAAIANVIQDPHTATLTPKLIEEIVSSFQRELNKLKKKDKKLYQKLDLSAEDEERFNIPIGQYTQSDWLRLRHLKEKIEELKRELQGQELPNLEYEQQVAHERKRHVYKRFNIREGWLPLH